MTWEDVLKRKDIVGGELEVSDGKHVYRGPISKIKIEENKRVCIELSWVARKPLKLGKSWKKWDTKRVFVSIDFKPKDIGNGIIQFGITRKSYSLIHPKGGSRLNPAKVKGLKMPK